MIKHCKIWKCMKHKNILRDFTLKISAYCLAPCIPPNIRTPDPLELCHESSLLPTGLEAMPTTSRSSGCGREIVTSLATAAVGRWSSLSRFSQGPKLGRGVFMSHFGSTLDTRVKQDLVVYVCTYPTYTNFYALAWKMGSGKITKTPIKNKVPESWWRGISWADKIRGLSEMYRLFEKSWRLSSKRWRKPCYFPWNTVILVVL